MLNLSTNHNELDQLRRQEDANVAPQTKSVSPSWSERMIEYDRDPSLAFAERKKNLGGLATVAKLRSSSKQNSDLT